MARDDAVQVEPVPIGAGRGPKYWGRFYLLLSIAAIVATIGLQSNSGAIVIAAMLLAPLMEPILGLASNLVQGYLLRVLRLLIATIVAAVVTIAWGYVILVAFDVPRGVEIPAEILARTSPGLPDLLVALVAGIAGSYVQMRREESGLLPGVAIGVSLVPPLAAAGTLFYFDKPGLAGGTVLLFLTNLAAIVLSASAVFLVLGLRPARSERGATLRVTFGTVVSLAVVIVIAGHLAERSMHHIRESREEQRISVAIREWAGEHPVEIRRVDVRGDIVEIRLLFGVPLSRAQEQVAPAELVSEDLSEGLLRERVAGILGRRVTLELSAHVIFQESVELPGPDGS